MDARKAKVVELRFFGGLSVEETADVLHVSTDTIKRGLAYSEAVAAPRARRQASCLTHQTDGGEWRSCATRHLSMTPASGARS